MTITDMTARFRADERGNFAAMVSIMMLAVLAMVGAAIDYTMLSSAQTRSQDMADLLALNAAAFYRANELIPVAGGADGGVPPGTYTAAELGFDAQGWVVDGADGMTFEISYDTVGGEAVVTARGKTISTFTQVMGFTELDFSSRSRVAFEQAEVTEVASLALVLDNSGSMAWNDVPNAADGTTPADAQSRISALEDSVTGLVNYLDATIGPQNGQNDKVFRMGMMAYNTTTITGRTRDMAWSMLNNGNIKSMTASGGTNSSDSMASAKTWMDGEEAIHQSENSRVPLRYVVFMTDGMNNNDGATWTDTSGTELWRRVRCYYYFSSGWSCWHSYSQSETKPSGSVGYYDWGFGYDYDWYEGEFDTPDDTATLADCDAMKADGVTIYTIGFGLEPGVYGDGAGGTETISSDTTDHAYAFLSDCATSSETFKTAASADELQAVFDSIGADILTESIRIKA